MLPLYWLIGKRILYKTMLMPTYVYHIMQITWIEYIYAPYLTLEYICHFIQVFYVYQSIGCYCLQPETINEAAISSHLCLCVCVLFILFFFCLFN